MIVKYFCDSCKKEVDDTYMLFPIKYEIPDGKDYEIHKDLCADCMNFIHRQIKDGINMKPCDTVISNE